MTLELELESSTPKGSTHYIQLWINRKDAFEIARRIINAMSDPEKEEVGISLFMKELEDIEGGE